MIPEIESKPLPELEKCLQDEDHLFLLLEDVEFYKGLDRMCDDARQANVRLAEKNLLKKPEIDKLQRELETMAAELAAMKRLHDEKSALQKSQMEKHSPQALLRLLEEAVRAIDDESEVLVRDFRAGNMPLKDFLSAYTELRKIYHSRAAKLEMMKQQVTM